MKEDPNIERLAREIILSCKGDPDMIVQLGTPAVFGTPSGDAFSVSPAAGIPMWRLYQGMAKRVLTIAREIDKPTPVDGITQVAEAVADLAIDKNPPPAASA